MQKDQSYFKILDFVRTKEDLNLIKDELDLLEKSLFEVKGETFDVVLDRKLPKEVSDLVRELTLKADKKSVILGLKKILDGLKHVEVTIAFRPTNKFVEDIWSEINKDRTEKVAIDLKTDKDIIGGALISYEGKFFDGSILKMLNDTLKSYV